jgi:hypothetical protein
VICLTEVWGTGQQTEENTVKRTLCRETFNLFSSACMLSSLTTCLNAQVVLVNVFFAVVLIMRLVLIVVSFIQQSCNLERESFSGE